MTKTNVRKIDADLLLEVKNSARASGTQFAITCELITSTGVTVKQVKQIEKLRIAHVTGHIIGYFTIRGVTGELDAAAKVAIETAKSKRTPLQKSAVEAANTSWKQVKEATGLKPAPKARQKAEDTGDDEEEPAIVIEAVHVPSFTSTTDLITFCLAFADIMERAQKAGEKYAIGGISATMTDCVTSLREVCDANKDGTF